MVVSVFNLRQREISLRDDICLGCAKAIWRRWPTKFLDRGIASIDFCKDRSFSFSCWFCWHYIRRDCPCNEFAAHTCEIAIWHQLSRHVLILQHTGAASSMLIVLLNFLNSWLGLRVLSERIRFAYTSQQGRDWTSWGRLLENRTFVFVKVSLFHQFISYLLSNKN